MYQAWVRGGEKSTHLRQKGHVFIVTGDKASLQNLQFAPKQIGIVDVQFNFLTEEVTNKDHFVYRAVQKFSGTGDIFGGETYAIHKSQRSLFYAGAGGDKTVDKNEDITLSAQPLNEPADYNWYDDEGDLIAQGIDFSTSVEIGKKYKLEVIALSDGYKDYADVKVSLKPNRVKTIYPNPTNGQITVDYQINQGQNAYLTITPVNGAMTTNNYMIDTDETDADLDLSLLPQGPYVVSLIVDGHLVDAKNLIKQ